MFNKNTYVLKYICFPALLLAGCSASSNQRVNTMDTVDSRMLVKRIDDLSSKINLIVNDANTLHNEMEEVKIFNKAIRQNVEGLQASISNLNEEILNLRIAAKTPDVATTPAEETDVGPALRITDSSKSSEVSESDIQKTEDTKGPLAVAKGFWDAINAKDMQSVKLYTTKESRDTLQIKDNDATTNCEVTFGEVKMEDNKSIIETTMQTKNGTTASEIQIRTILVREDGQWKVDPDQTMMSMFGEAMGEMIKGLGKAIGEGLKNGMEEMGKSMAEGMQKGFEELPQTSAVTPDITPSQQETTLTPEQTKTEGIQKDPEEMTQTGTTKPDVTPPKQETTVTNEISEQTKRELFVKDNIVRLASAEFPDNKGIQWNILSFEHKTHLTYVEAEPTPATLGYPHFKFVISFKNPEVPRIIGIFCFKDGQYSLLDTKKK